MKRYIVGSTVKKRKHLGRLPRNSVVVNAFGLPQICRGHETVSSLGTKQDVCNGDASAPPYTVIYLP